MPTQYHLITAYPCNHGEFFPNFRNFTRPLPDLPVGYTLAGWDSRCTSVSFPNAGAGWVHLKKWGKKKISSSRMPGEQIKSQRDGMFIAGMPEKHGKPQRGDMENHSFLQNRVFLRQAFDYAAPLGLPEFFFGIWL